MHILGLSILCNVSAHKIIIGHCWGHLLTCSLGSLLNVTKKFSVSSCICSVLEGWPLCALIQASLPLAFPLGSATRKPYAETVDQAVDEVRSIHPCSFHVLSDVTLDETSSPIQTAFCKGFILVVLIPLPSYFRYCNMLATKLKIVL